MSEPTLCVVATCQPLIGDHLDTCAHHSCRGCQPKDAAPGLMVCNQCRRSVLDRIERLPGLYADLLIPTRIRTGTGSYSEPGDLGPATLAETRSPGGDGALGARAEIRNVMVTWAKILHKDLDVALPADTIEALIVHIRRHAPTLLAHPEHAERLVAEIDWVYRLAQRNAYQAGPPGQALGQCPTCRTVVRASDTGPARCRGCGSERTIDDWQALIVGELDAEKSATAADLLAWLSRRHNRPVTHTALRHWASKGVRIPKPDGGHELVHLARLGTDHQSRALYSVADAARIGVGLYGPVRTGVSA